MTFCRFLLAASLGAVFAVGSRGSVQSPRENRDALLVADFETRIAEYVQLHKKEAAQLPPLKPTDSPARINDYQTELAQKIRDARRGAREGDIFTPPIAAEFRRLIGIAMQGRDSALIRTSLRRGEPVRIPVAVNGVYPSTVPLQTTPPSLLLNLPNLPPEMDYRVVGRDLVLRDATANLIVDFIPRAIS